MCLLGWSCGTFDAEHPMRFLTETPHEELKLSTWNIGSYGNPRVDELLPQIQRELCPEAQQGMIVEVHATLKDDVAYVPLHIQPLVRAVRQGIGVRQRQDNFFFLSWVRLDG